MTVAEAVQRWEHAQQQIVQGAYLKAWQTGVKNFQQSQRPRQATPTTRVPAQPQDQAQKRATQQAINSLKRMGQQLIATVPLSPGSSGNPLLTALLAYLASNAYRLAGGASVAWAGEQHGYAQTAAANGVLLKWELEPSVAHHCADCPALAGLPAMPLGMWPTLPGDGDTECSTGCKCSMRAVGPSNN